MKYNEDEFETNNIEVIFFKSRRMEGKKRKKFVRGKTEN